MRRGGHRGVVAVRGDAVAARGWAAVIAFGAVAASTSRWRWIGIVHLVLTMLVISATGHHWWLDGIVALALLWLALLWVALQLDTLGRRAVHTVRVIQVPDAPAVVEVPNDESVDALEPASVEGEAT